MEWRPHIIIGCSQFAEEILQDAFDLFQQVIRGGEAAESIFDADLPGNGDNVFGGGFSQGIRGAFGSKQDELERICRRFLMNWEILKQKAKQT